MLPNVEAGMALLHTLSRGSTCKLTALLNAWMLCRYASARTDMCTYAHTLMRIRMRKHMCTSATLMFVCTYVHAHVLKPRAYMQTGSHAYVHSCLPVADFSWHACALCKWPLYAHLASLTCMRVAACCWVALITATRGSCSQSFKNAPFGPCALVPQLGMAALLE